MATRLKNNRFLFYFLLLIPSVFLALSLMYGVLVIADYYYPSELVLLFVYLAAFAAVTLLISSLFHEIRPGFPLELCILVPGSLALWFFREGLPYSWFSQILKNGVSDSLYIVLLLLPFTYVAVLFLCVLLSLIKHREFIEHCLLLRLIRFLQNRQSIRKKVFLEIFGCFLCIASVSFIVWLTLGLHNLYYFLVAAPALYVSLLWFLFVRTDIGDAECLTGLIADLSVGEFPEENPLNPKSILFDAGEQLVHIGKITEEGIRKGVAGEKLKVELIANVSHDLRTPLTSIIGYCEQLTSMELPGEAGDFAERLQYKSKYLYKMVEDLFDLSKTASGNVSLEPVAMDLKRLLEQTLGDLNDKIVRSGFVIRKHLPEEPLMVYADGFRMHRVFQNLLENALKYSLPGSRIHIFAKQEGEDISVSFLNTASYDMNFDETEITERFVRGDSSRSGEGSGLGLAIAKTYTEACNGTFSVSVRGDQFEALVTLPVLKEI